MNATSSKYTKRLFTKSFLKLKVDEKLAASVLTVLLSIVSQDEELFYDKKLVFDFMLENMILELIQ